MPDNKDYLGKGIKFPPQINPATGKFVTVSEEESVKQSLYLILMTQRSERPLRPNFGSNIMSYTFMDQNAGTLGMMKRTIKEQITAQEPRVSNVQVTLESGSQRGVLLFNIEYTVISTNSRNNFVFPFYLNVTPDEKSEGEPEIYEPEIVEETGD